MLQKNDLSMNIVSVLVVAICGTSSSMIISVTPVSAQIQIPMSGSTSSTSMVNGVSVTAMNVTDDNKIIVNLNYAGNGTITPAVTLMATAINIHAKDLNSMLSTLMKGLGNTSSTQGTSLSASRLPNILTGSNVLYAGWNSPASVTIKLQGNTTTPLHNANLISVQVFPFTG